MHTPHLPFDDVNFFDEVCTAAAHMSDKTILLLRSYLTHEWVHYYPNDPQVFDATTMPVRQIKVPSQENAFDCGVYMLQYLHQYLLSPSPFLVSDSQVRFSFLRA